MDAALRIGKVGSAEVNGQEESRRGISARSGTNMLPFKLGALFDDDVVV